MSVIVEIRAAEGGDDAKLLVHDQAAIYGRYARLHDVRLDAIEERPGILVLLADGPRVADLFAGESGGHRWQRVPPTEKKGRVHTSTVTVAVLAMPTEQQVVVYPGEVEVTTTRGSGPGGQHRNKTDSCVVVRHLPTGIVVRCDAERSQTQNRTIAMGTLRARLLALREAEAETGRAGDRRAKVGTGMRGDKIRTVRVRDGRVTDHRTGRRATLDRYLSGHLEDVL